MEDFKENFAKIIEAKTKQIKVQADKFESQIKIEINKIFLIQKEIEELKKVNNEEEVLLKESEIKDIRKNINRLNKEKREALGCDINIGFNDDHYIKSSYDI